MDKPIISYVIPCYNCETSIIDTVESIKYTHEEAMQAKEKESQWPNIEIILVNDGSTDATGIILEYLKQKYSNVRVIDNGKNLGRGCSRNKGNEAAEAEIIAVLDSDDIHVADRTNEILSVFEEETKAEVFYSSFYIKNLDTNDIDLKVAGRIDREFLQKTGQFKIGHSTVAYKKKTIQTFPYSEDKNHDDWAMLWTMFSHGVKFTYSEKPLVTYTFTNKGRANEFIPGKQESILRKKQQIMEPYFKGESNVSK